MLNILQTEIAFADWLMENLLKKSQQELCRTVTKEHAWN